MQSQECLNVVHLRADRSNPLDDHDVSAAHIGPKVVQDLDGSLALFLGTEARDGKKIHFLRNLGRSGKITLEDEPAPQDGDQYRIFIGIILRQLASKFFYAHADLLGGEEDLAGAIGETDLIAGLQFRDFFEHGSTIRHLPRMASIIRIHCMNLLSLESGFAFINLFLPRALPGAGRGLPT